MRSVPIDKATDPELRQFALERLGIQVHSNWKTETVLAKIKAAWDKAEIEVEDKPTMATVSSLDTQRAKSGEKRRPTHARLMIHMSDKIGGTDPVPLGVNGKIMLVPRDQEVTIPYPYFLVLDNAVEHRSEPGPGGLGLAEPRKIHAYPFRLIELLYDDAVAA